MRMIKISGNENRKVEANYRNRCTKFSASGIEKRSIAYQKRKSPEKRGSPKLRLVGIF
jgi:hypothetical protein